MKTANAIGLAVAVFAAPLGSAAAQWSGAGASQGMRVLPPSDRSEELGRQAEGGGGKGGGDDLSVAKELKKRKRRWYAKRRENDRTDRVTAFRSGRPYRTTVYAVGDGEHMAWKAAYAFFRLFKEAKRDGIRISPLSGFRTFSEQAYLYRKYGSPRAAPPGYSNHQQGLSMDIEGIGGYDSREYRWLKKHAPKYGIRNDVPGEEWHWTYVR